MVTDGAEAPSSELDQRAKTKRAEITRCNSWGILDIPLLRSSFDHDVPLQIKEGGLIHLKVPRHAVVQPGLSWRPKGSKETDHIPLIYGGWRS